MKKSLKRPLRVAIVGAGFAGIYAYLELHKKFHHTRQLQVTLINKTDYLTFIPMIHKVATGLLLPSSITQPIRTLPHCCMEQFIEGEVYEVDCDKRIVKVLHQELATGEEEPHTRAQRNIEVPYDYLVLAMGSVTNYFGVPGAEEYALPLKTLQDAKRLKNRIIESFQDAARIPDPEKQKDALRFVIVGGGPTGIELAGELADLIDNELARSFPELKDLAQVVIVERGGKLVRNAGEWFSSRVEEIVENNSRIYVMYDTSVEEVTKDGVRTSDGFLGAAMVVWSGGVKASELAVTASKDVDRDERSGKLKTTSLLSLNAYPEIYVGGDQAWVYDTKHEQPYPMRAQFAVRQGQHIAQNIVRDAYEEKKEPFDWHEKGFIMSLGKGGALAELFGIKLKGSFAWFIYRSAYLYAIVGFRAELRTALEWTLNLFSSRDISKL